VKSGLWETRSEVRPGKTVGRVSMKDHVVISLYERSRSVMDEEKIGILEVEVVREDMLLDFRTRRRRRGSVVSDSRDESDVKRFSSKDRAVIGTVKLCVDGRLV
jgi:hypothetical protein